VSLDLNLLQRLGRINGLGEPLQLAVVSQELDCKKFSIVPGAVEGLVSSTGRFVTRTLYIHTALLAPPVTANMQDRVVHHNDLVGVHTATRAALFQ
jgi:hypothetical protein